MSRWRIPVLLPINRQQTYRSRISCEAVRVLEPRYTEVIFLDETADHSDTHGEFHCSDTTFLDFAS